MTPDHLLQVGMVRMLLEGRLPDRPRLILAAHGPQHLTQVGGDLPVLHRARGLGQILQGDLRVTEPVVDPADAVQDRRLVRLDPVGALDVAQGLLIAIGAIGQGVTERIERIGVVRIALDDLPQVALGADAI